MTTTSSSDGSGLQSMEIVNGVIVGFFQGERMAIIHTVQYGRALICCKDWNSQMRLGTWWQVSLTHNHKRTASFFRWSPTCSYMAHGAVRVKDLLPTTTAKNNAGAEYVVVITPLLVGATTSSMGICYSPFLGRCTLTLRPNMHPLGTCMMGRVVSIGANEDRNGRCCWGVRDVLNDAAVTTEPFSDVLRYCCKYFKFEDGQCVLKVLDWKPDAYIAFGICDFMEGQITEEQVKQTQYFTAWAGPLCPANNDPVRAFYVEPMGEELLQNVQNPIAENAMGSSAEAVDVISSKIAVVRPYVDEVDYKSVQLSDDDGITAASGDTNCSADCRALAILGKLMASCGTKEVLKHSDPQLYSDIAGYLSNINSQLAQTYAMS